MQDDSRLITTNSILYESMGESLGLKDWYRLLGLRKAQDTADPKRQATCVRTQAQKGG